MFRKKKEHLAVFYNVENLFDTEDNPDTNDSSFLPDGSLKWTKRRYLDKLNSLATTIGGITGSEKLPAFIGLSEVENLKVVKALAATSPLNKGDYGIVHKDSKDTRGIDIAFLYDKSIFDYKGHSWHSFEKLEQPPITGRDILEVFGKIGKQKFRFFINHWPSRRKGENETSFKREAAAFTLRTAIDEHWNDDDAIVVMGDFNDEPHNKSIVEIAKAKKASQNKEDLINLAHRYDGQKVGTLVYEDNWYTFDQFFISLNLLKGTSHGYRVKKMYIYRDESLLHKAPDSLISQPNRSYVGTRYVGGISDHLPVFIRIRK